MATAHVLLRLGLSEFFSPPARDRLAAGSQRFYRWDVDMAMTRSAGHGRVTG